MLRCTPCKAVALELIAVAKAVSSGAVGTIVARIDATVRLVHSGAAALLRYSNV